MPGSLALLSPLGRHGNFPLPALRYAKGEHPTTARPVGFISLR